MPGAQTVRLPDRRALTVTSATLSGVDANGAASRPAVIDERTKPGRTTRTDAPDPTSESPRPWANPSRPAFDEPYTKFDARTRSPATLESTTRWPWPCARNCAATARPMLTAPA